MFGDDVTILLMAGYDPEISCSDKPFGVGKWSTERPFEQ